MAERKQKRYFGLTRSGRASIERELGKRRPSARGVARDLGHSPASISDEAKRNRTVAKGPGKGERVEEVPEDACARLQAWPWTCNGRRHRRYGCGKALHCEHSAARAQTLAEGLLSEARRGVNAKEYDFERAMGLSSDTRRILTLHSRPCRVQACLLLPEKSSSAVAAAFDSLETTLGKKVFRLLASIYFQPIPPIYFCQAHQCVFTDCANVLLPLLANPPFSAFRRAGL